MNIKLLEVRFGTGGGSALAHLYGQERISMFDRRPYVAVHITFTHHSILPDSACAHPNQVILPRKGERPHLRINFLLDPPMYANGVFDWPEPGEIMGGLTQAIELIVSAAVQLYGPDYDREVYANTVAL